MIRTAAAAAAGHSGAQIAVHRAAAVGARVEVWWPLDEDWYVSSLTACQEQCSTVQWVSQYEARDMLPNVCDFKILGNLV